MISTLKGLIKSWFLLKGIDYRKIIRKGENKKQTLPFDINIMTAYNQRIGSKDLLSKIYKNSKMYM